MPFKEYVIIVRGERFVLARDQILFDSPNYFTSLFDGPFKESSEGKREAVLYRDPFLFRLIESYLSGYQILPLPTVGPPQYMSREAMVKNLFADAQFYQLDGLIKLLDPFVNTKYSVFQLDLPGGAWYHVGDISPEQAHSMVKYAKQSASCTVVYGFHLDPHNKNTYFEWFQQFPRQWVEQPLQVLREPGALVPPYMAYHLVKMRITLSQK